MAATQEPINLVIVVWNAASYTKKCIESVRRYTDYPHLITVVDNGSTDGTLSYLQTQPDITVIKNKENVGYSQAIIQGYERTKTRLVCAMNNDIVVSPGWLEPMVRIMKEKPEIGILGPLRPAGFCMHPYLNEDTRRVLENTRGKDLPTPEGWLQKFCFPYDYELFTLEVKRRNNFGLKFLDGPPSFVSTCCALINSEVAESVGGLAKPKDYKWGSDDVDLSWRISTHGFKVALTSDVYVHHFKHVSADLNTLDRNKLAEEDMLNFYKKWEGTIKAYLQDQINKGIDIRALLKEDNWEFWYLARLQKIIGHEIFWRGVEGPISHKERA